MGTQRTRNQRAAERARALRLHFQGYTQAQTAAQTGASQRQVSRDLAAMRKAFRLRLTAEELTRLRNRVLAQTDLAEAEAWGGWHGSRQDGHRTVSRISSESTWSGNVGGGARVERSETIWGRLGDPRFLLMVLRCVDCRCRILGLGPRPEAGQFKDWPRIVREAEDILRTVPCPISNQSPDN